MKTAVQQSIQNQNTTQPAFQRPQNLFKAQSREAVPGKIEQILKAD